MNLSVQRDERANVADDYAWTDTLLSNTTLPALTLNFRQFTLAPSLRAGQKGSFLGDLLRNTYFKHDYSYRDEWESHELTTIKDSSASGKWSLTVRPPRVGIFNVSFSANASQAWSRHTEEGEEWIPGIAATDSTEARWRPLRARCSARSVAASCADRAAAPSMSSASASSA